MIKEERAKKDIDPEYIFRQIRNNRKKAEIHNLETDKVVLYPATYKAALALDQNTPVIGANDGKVWRKGYAIKIFTESF